MGNWKLPLNYITSIRGSLSSLCSSNIYSFFPTYTIYNINPHFRYISLTIFSFINIFFFISFLFAKFCWKIIITDFFKMINGFDEVTLILTFTRSHKYCRFDACGLRRRGERKGAAKWELFARVATSKAIRAHQLSNNKRHLSLFFFTVNPHGPIMQNQWVLLLLLFKKNMILKKQKKNVDEVFREKKLISSLSCFIMFFFLNWKLWARLKVNITSAQSEG